MRLPPVGALVATSFIFVHRWLGAALCALLLLWFLSGAVMMYHAYPSVSLADRLQRAPRLDPAAIRFTPAGAFGAASVPLPPYALLSSFDGRPAYMGNGRLVYADDGREQGPIDSALIDRMAAAWVGLPLAQATKRVVREVDQWTLGGGLRRMLPLYKYSWPDGQEVYVHGETAEVVQHTTRASRAWSYLGAIPHWLYVPALRTRDGTWHSLMVWSSLMTVVSAILGLTVALWMYSPAKRYQYRGAPSSIPYRGWKRWHTLTGLAFGAMTITWAFSGLLSLEPFRWVQQLSELTEAGRAADDGRGMRAWQRMSEVLRGGPGDLSAFAARTPGEAIRSLPDFDAKELEHGTFAGQPIYVVTNGLGETRIVPVTGAPIEGFDAADMIARMRGLADAYPASITLMREFDLYYRDRLGRLPLPVIKVEMADSWRSRFYVNPLTATVVGSYSQRDWVNRWLFQGLHSLDFPWLYNHRPLWDIVVLGLMLGGTALCGTSLVLTVRLLARKLAPLAGLLQVRGGGLPAESIERESVV